MQDWFLDTPIVRAIEEVLAREIVRSDAQIQASRKKRERARIKRKRKKK